MNNLEQPYYSFICIYYPDVSGRILIIGDREAGMDRLAILSLTHDFYGQRFFQEEIHNRAQAHRVVPYEFPIFATRFKGRVNHCLINPEITDGGWWRR